MTLSTEETFAEIRQLFKETNEKFKETDVKFKETDERFKETNARLDRRFQESIGAPLPKSMATARRSICCLKIPTKSLPLRSKVS